MNYLSGKVVMILRGVLIGKLRKNFHTQLSVHKAILTLIRQQFGPGVDWVDPA